MKKIISLILAILLVCVCLLFTGCDKNKEPIKIHVSTHDYSGCLEVKYYSHVTNGIKVVTVDGEELFLSTGTFLVVDNVCFICYR